MALYKKYTLTYCSVLVRRPKEKYARKLKVYENRVLRRIFGPSSSSPSSPPPASFSSFYSSSSFSYDTTTLHVFMVFYTRLFQAFLSLTSWILFPNFNFCVSFITSSLRLFFGGPFVLIPKGF